MRRDFWNMIGLLLPAVLLTLTACTPVPVVNTVFDVEVVDQAGRTVKLVKIPDRIISLAPGNTEILFALGLEDKIVGVTDFCNYPSVAKEKPKVGGFSTPNLEKVVSAAPDLVLATAIHEKTVTPRLKELGIKVITLDPDTLDQTLDAITLAGKVTGKEKQASDVVYGMKTRIKAVKDRTDGLLPAQKPRVLYITWHNPLMAAGLGTLQDELIRVAGGDNIAHNLINHAKISLEAVVVSNPEVIIAGVGMGEGGDATLRFARTEERLKNINAVRSNRIYPVDTDVAGRAGPRIADALEQFAVFIHPELFGEEGK